MAVNNLSEIYNDKNILDFRGDYKHDEEIISAKFASPKYDLFREHLLLNKYGLVNVILGAGDGARTGITDVKMYGSFFDIFVCLPQISPNFERNVEDINTHYPNQKLICLLDTDNLAHILTFAKIFKNKVSYIDFDEDLLYFFVPYIVDKLLCYAHIPKLQADEEERLIRENANHTLAGSDLIKYQRYIESPPTIPAGVIIFGSKLRESSRFWGMIWGRRTVRSHTDILHLICDTFSDDPKFVCLYPDTPSMVRTLRYANEPERQTTNSLIYVTRKPIEHSGGFRRCRSKRRRRNRRQTRRRR